MRPCLNKTKQNTPKKNQTAVSKALSTASEWRCNIFTSASQDLVLLASSFLACLLLHMPLFVQYQPNWHLNFTSVPEASSQTKGPHAWVIGHDRFSSSLNFSPSDFLLKSFCSLREPSLVKTGASQVAPVLWLQRHSRKSISCPKGRSRQPEQHRDCLKGNRENKVSTSLPTASLGSPLFFLPL